MAKISNGIHVGNTGRSFGKTSGIIIVAILARIGGEIPRESPTRIPRGVTVSISEKVLGEIAGKTTAGID